MMKFTLTADIGGSHLTAAIVSIDARAVLKETQQRVPVDCHASLSEILNQWSTALNKVMDLSGLEIDHLSLAVPGPFDYQNGVSLIKGMHKYDALYGADIKQLISNATGITAKNIVFRNDAEAFLHGEVIAGAASGYNHVAGLTLGTGMGSAISKNGNTWDANWGSLSYQDSIADDWFSTRWFVNNFYEQTGIRCSGVKELAILASKNSQANDVFKLFGRNLGDFIGKQIENDPPHCVILGGNIARCHELFLHELCDRLAPHIAAGNIKLAELGEDAALVGAAFTSTVELHPTL
jgi:glucokinase